MRRSLFVPLKSEGGNAFLRTVTRKGVQSAISNSLWEKIDNPIVFKYMGEQFGGSDIGGDSQRLELEATINLIEVCDTLIQARNDDLLAPSQAFLAVQAEIIMRST